MALLKYGDECGVIEEHAGVGEMPISFLEVMHFLT
jgi:hypothetical protein